MRGSVSVGVERVGKANGGQPPLQLPASKLTRVNRGVQFPGTADSFAFVSANICSEFFFINVTFSMSPIVFRCKRSSPFHVEIGIPFFYRLAAGEEEAEEGSQKCQVLVLLHAVLYTSNR